MIQIPRNSDAVAIDPGYGRKTGGNALALACRGILSDAWFERPYGAPVRPHLLDHGTLDYVIAEQPQQDGRSWVVPPAVLISLAWQGALLAGIYTGANGATLHDPTVREWKGSENKVPMHRRLWAVLSPAEREVLGGDTTTRAIIAACEKGAMCRWSKSGPELYPSTFTAHNKLDAAALLMVALGRLEKVG